MYEASFETWPPPIQDTWVYPKGALNREVPYCGVQTLHGELKLVSIPLNLIKHSLYPLIPLALGLFTLSGLLSVNVLHPRGPVVTSAYEPHPIIGLEHIWAY